MGPQHPRTAAGLNNVGGALVALRRFSEALPLLTRSVEVMKALPGPEHPNQAIFEFNLADALVRLGRYDEAEPILRKTTAVMERAFGPEHLYRSYPMVTLGLLLHARGDASDEAQSLLEEGLEIRQTQPAPEPERAEAAFALAQVLWSDATQHRRARRLAEQARDWFASAGPGHALDRDDVSAWLRARSNPPTGSAREASLPADPIDQATVDPMSPRR